MKSFVCKLVRLMILKDFILLMFFLFRYLLYMWIPMDAIRNYGLLRNKICWLKNSRRNPGKIINNVNLYKKIRKLKKNQTKNRNFYKSWEFCKNLKSFKLNKFEKIEKYQKYWKTRVLDKTNKITFYFIQTHSN